MHPPRILEGFQFSTGTQISVPDPWGMRRSCVRLSEIFGWSLVLRYGRRPRYESVTLWTSSPCNTSVWISYRQSTLLNRSMFTPHLYISTYIG